MSPFRRRRAYVLLETVVATGLLIVGLAVIGAQIQDSDTSIRKMERRIRALMLAELQLAELEMGLIELESVDEVEEQDFGPRYPDNAWRLTTEETAIEDMYLLKLEILHHYREEEYQEDDFDFDNAETVHTVYAMRAAPQPLSFGEDFGMAEDELVKLSENLSELGIEGLDPQAFDPRFLQTVDFEELLKALPLLMDALGMDLTDFVSALPPGLLQQIKDSGLLEGETESGLLEELGRGRESP